MQNVHVPVAGSYVPVAGRIRHNVNEWNNYYSFIRMDRIQFRLSTKYDWIFKTRKFCYFFVCMENESKCKWRTLKIIDTSFLKGSFSCKWVKKSIFFSSLFDCISIQKYACKISGRNSKNCGSHEFFCHVMFDLMFWN